MICNGTNSAYIHVTLVGFSRNGPPVNFAQPFAFGALATEARAADTSLNFWLTTAWTCGKYKYRFICEFAGIADVNESVPF